MIKKLLIAILIAGACYAQPGPAPNSVYQILASARATTGTTATVNNIGQTQHLLVTTFSDNGANTCVTPAGTILLQYSFDNVHFVAFGGATSPVPVSAALASAYFTSGTGSFPYVRARLLSFDNTNCVATIWYSGTVVSQFVLNNGFQPRAGPYNSLFNSPVGVSILHVASNATTTFTGGNAGNSVYFTGGLLYGIQINTKGAASNTIKVYSTTLCTDPGALIANIDSTVGTGLFTYNAQSSDGSGFCVITATGTAPDISILFN